MFSKKRQAAEKQLQNIVDFKRTFGSDYGDRVLKDLMNKFWVTRPTYSQGDPTETAFREGQRSVVLAIMNTIGHDLEKLQQRINSIEGEDEYE